MASSGADAAAVATRAHRAENLPWVEKYRPRNVDEVSHQTEVTDTLRNSLEQKNLPHLIFYGPPGTGKTSTILACARQLFGADYKSRVMELNASDERGIAVVRTKIKGFAQVAVTSSGPNGPPPYKLIVLDEADSMTQDAQSALRRTMETYSRVTRFCIICNYITRLIPPIASRCAKFRFKALPADAMSGRLRHIASAEGVDIPDDALTELMAQSEGDMRRAIQMLQSLHQLHGCTIAPQAVLDISGSLPKERVTKVLAVVCKSSAGDGTQGAAAFDALQAVAADLLADGYPVSQLATQLLEAVLADALPTPLSSVQKAKLAVQLAELDKSLTDGADECLQLTNLLAFCQRTCAQPVPVR